MKVVSPEKLCQHYPNKYLAINVAALEARRLIEQMHRDEIELPRSPYELALEAVLRGELQYTRLTETDIQALSREGVEETAWRQPL